MYLASGSLERRLTGVRLYGTALPRMDHASRPADHAVVPWPRPINAIADDLMGWGALVADDLSGPLDTFDKLRATLQTAFHDVDGVYGQTDLRVNGIFGAMIMSLIVAVLAENAAAYLAQFLPKRACGKRSRISVPVSSLVPSEMGFGAFSRGCNEGRVNCPSSPNPLTPCTDSANCSPCS